MNEERKILINSNPGANAETTNTPGSKRFSGHRRPNANGNSNDRRFPNKGGRGGNRRNFRERPKDDFEEKVVTIRRVTKVTKGGRHFRFAAVVVVGNKKGLVGLGTGKANEVPDAIKKAVKEGKKNLIRIPMRGTTIPHEVLGNYGAGKVLIKPAKEGTGVIAGGPVRAVVELAGINDIYTKSLGSHTPINMIRAALDGLKQIQTQNTIRELRFGITPKAEVKTETKTITPTAVKVEVK